MVFPADVLFLGSCPQVTDCTIGFCKNPLLPLLLLLLLVVLLLNQLVMNKLQETASRHSPAPGFLADLHLQ